MPRSNIINAPDDTFISFVQKHLGFMRFLFIGSINTLIDLILFAIFANLLSLNIIIASILSTGITLIFSFIMNHYFVFRSTKRKRHTIGLFIVVTLLNVWLIQSSIIFLSINVLDNISFFEDHIWTMNMLAKVFGVSVSMVLNYIGYRKLFSSLGRTQ